MKTIVVYIAYVYSSPCHIDLVVVVLLLYYILCAASEAGVRPRGGETPAGLTKAMLVVF